MEEIDTLERKALKNTRALVDMLEVDEHARARRQKRAIVILAVAALIPVVVVTLWALNHPNETLADKQLRDCKVAAWSAKASERTEQIRAANPGMSYPEISKKLKKEQHAFMESVKVACENNPGKAKP
jgi:signal transduction histidine kinase